MIHEIRKDDDADKPARPEFEQADIWCVSGEFKEKRTAHNFAVKLLDVNEEQAVILASGRLRQGVLMNVEIQFAGLNGKLQSPARVMDSEEIGDLKGLGYHRTTLKFQGRPLLLGEVKAFITGKEVNLGPSLTLVESSPSSSWAWSTWAASPPWSSRER
ncbi:MAG: hypothetical protein ACYTAF_03395 [Planctomycetota bacterium]|jgi:hypothetical protein